MASTIGSVPPGIPMARPIATEALPFPITVAYAPKATPPPLSALRAIIELILVVPAAIIGATLAVVIASPWRPSDERWLNISDSMGLGLGAAIACLLMVRIGGRRLSSIGWTSRTLARNIAIGLVGLILTYGCMLTFVAALVLVHPPILGNSEAQKAIEKAFPRMSLPMILFVCVCVAFYEEVVFRGFLLTRLQAILRRWWLTIPLSSIGFGILHFYEGPLAMGLISILALSMSLLFVWRKSLVPCMVLHLLHNVIAFVLLGAISKSWQ